MSQLLSCLRRYLSAVFALFFATPTAMAAEITLRPDLRGHLSELRTIYPWQGLRSARGEAQPERPVRQGEASGGLPIISEFARPGLRVIQFSGVIEEGDTERLRAALFDRGTSWSAQAMVVFDSPGGDMLEGIRMGIMLASAIEAGGGDTPLEGVAVLSGNQCMSACALAFALATDVSWLDRRFIEDGAELGFHMGRLPEYQMQQVAQVERVMDFAYEVVRAYNRLTDTGANPPLLLTMALEHRRPNSFFHLRGGLRSWFFGFTPVSRGVLAQPVSASGMTMWTLGQICRQTLIADRVPVDGLMAEFGQFWWCESESLSDLTASEGRASIAYAPDGSDVACRATMRADGSIALHPFLLSFDCRSPVGNDPVPQRCLLPAQAPGRADPTVTVGMLADATGCAGGRLTERGYSPTLPLYFEDQGQSRLTAISRGREVLRAVNMRDEPGLDGRRLGTLQPGEAVSVQGCTLRDDGQGVWMNIRHASGEGWVSARFLTPGIDDRIADLIPWEE